MSDMGEIFGAMREATKAHRAKKLAEADTTGWQALSEYHFRRSFGSTRIDWWPSGGKAQVFVKGSGRPPRMVYGHANVRKLITGHMAAQGGAA